MENANTTEIRGSANVIGDHSQSIAPSQQVTVNIPDLLARFETDKSPVGAHSPWDRVTVSILAVFVLFCVVAVFAPFLLYEYSARTPAMQDVQDLVLTLSGAMSGMTGLVGVLVGHRIRDSRLTR